MQNKSYRGSLSRLLSDLPGTNGEIQILKTGTYYSDLYGEFRITPDDLRMMKKNFDDKVRGVDCAIDYEHNNMSHAAGWIEGLELKADDNELWAFVKWTPNGEIKVKDREYRYTSAEFEYNYISNETKEEFGPTLFGAALTNRPFVKEMQPISLTEKEKNMDELKALKEQVDALTATIAEKDSKIEAFEKQNKELEEAKKLSEKKSEFDALLTNGKAVEAQRESYMLGDFKKYTELQQVVKLKEEGTKEEPKEESKSEDASKVILKLAEEMVSKKEAKSLGEAIDKVRASKPELKEQHLKVTKV